MIGIIKMIGVDDYKTELVHENKKSIIVNYDFYTMQEAFDRYAQDGELIQHAFPFLSDDEREFMLTGMSKEEWDNLFGEDDDA
jgi:hypothetical protein